MTQPGPDFDDLVGTDLPPEERDRLLQVHALLLEAGPPPDPGAVPLRRAPVVRDRLPRAAALAAAIGVLVFALGFLAGDRRDSGTWDVVTMRGAVGAADASARIEIFDADSAGNWPMELDVQGLAPPPAGGLYQLWLTRDGEPVALCGSFLAEPDGTTVVPMNAPWRLDQFDGWVVVVEGSTTPVLST